MLINPNPMWLVDAVTVELITGHDKYQKPTYGSKQTFEHIRFDHKTQKTGTGNERAVTRVGTLFFYAFNQSAMPDKSWIDARITDSDGNQYTVQTVTPYHQDTSTDLYSVEVEVL